MIEKQHTSFEPRPYQRNVFKMLAENPDVKPLMWGRPRSQHFIGVDYGYGGDKTVVTHAMKHKGRVYMYFDEYDDFGGYKLWRNPIKWYRWHKTMRLLRKHGGWK